MTSLPSGRCIAISTCICRRARASALSSTKTSWRFIVAMPVAFCQGPDRRADIHFRAQQPCGERSGSTGRTQLKERSMLYLVRMDVHLPLGMPAAQADEIKAREKAYAQDLQRQGKWQQLYRVVGEYANYSVFDVESNDELHTLLSALPLFPYMTMQVIPSETQPPEFIHA